MYLNCILPTVLVTNIRFIVYILNYFLILMFFSFNNTLLYRYDFFLIIQDKILNFLELIIQPEFNLNLLLAVTWLFILVFKRSINFFFLGFLTISIFCLSNNLQIFYFFTIQKALLNVKLLNGFFLIHPFVVYFFFAISLVLAYNQVVGIKYLLHKQQHSFSTQRTYLQKKYKTVNYRLFFSLLNLAIIFGFVAIILGAWWAFQEISWNGWWSWDLIELINLTLLLYLLALKHKFNPLINGGFYYFLVIFFLVIFFLAISRYNILSSIHNFISVVNLTFVFYLVLFSLFLIIYLIFFTKGLLLLKRKHFTFFIVNLNYFFFISIFSLFFVKILLEYTYYSLNLNYFYVDYIYAYQNALFIIAAVLYLFKLNIVYLYIMICTNYWFFLLVLIANLCLICTTHKPILLYSLHSLIFMFVITQYLSKSNLVVYSINFLNLDYLMFYTYKINMLYIKGIYGLNHIYNTNYYNCFWNYCFIESSFNSFLVSLKSGLFIVFYQKLFFKSIVLSINYFLKAITYYFFNIFQVFFTICLLIIVLLLPILFTWF